MSHSISREFTFAELFRFAIPSIIMMIFMSLYTIVDGFFVSRYEGANALSAMNIVWPLISTIIAIGVMFASGGSAIVARQMGEGKPEDANHSFSLIVFAALFFGTTCALLFLVFMDPIVHFLGASGSLVKLCKDYLVILMIFAPMSVLQLLFQNFFVTAGRPKLGLVLTIAGGFSNMFFDYLLIVPFGMGVKGAAYATAASYCIPAIGGLIFFTLNRKGLHFTTPSRSMSLVAESASNGSSEMVSNLSGSVTTILFNLTMLELAGSAGVAAISAVLYCQFLMVSLFLGFSIGIASVISFHWGARNLPFLHRTLKHCACFVLFVSVLTAILSFSGSALICNIFFPAEQDVASLAAHGMQLFSFSFLFAGLNIFASSFFTALGNGRVSAAISFTRTFLFTIIGIIIMSYLWGLDGLWLAVPFAEFATALFVLWTSKTLRNDYGLL